jgi:hypothetical protein
MKNFLSYGLFPSRRRSTSEATHRGIEKIVTGFGRMFLAIPAC